MEIAAWYETLGYEYTVVDGAGFGENQGRVRLQEVTDGTVVRWTFNYELSGVLGGLRNAMRKKRGTTKQIQDSLRNLHKLIQTESGGISTHQARANVREAPDVDDRSMYTPRHPSSYIDPATDTEELLEEDIALPLMFEIEQASAAPHSVPGTDTKPNPVVQTGDIVAEVERQDTVLEEATQPIDMEIISYEPLEVSEHEEPENKPVEIQKPVSEPPKAAIEPPPREPRAVDTSAVSVFELFGLRKPSEAGGQLLDDKPASDRAAVGQSPEEPGKTRVDDPFRRMEALQQSSSSAIDRVSKSDQLAIGGRLDEPVVSEGRIIGWRRKTRMRQYLLRSHNS